MAGRQAAARLDARGPFLGFATRQGPGVVHSSARLTWLGSAVPGGWAVTVDWPAAA